MANKKRFTEPDELEALKGVVKSILGRELSYRAGAEKLLSLTGKKISHEGLRIIVKLQQAANDREYTEGLGSQSSELPD